MSVLFALPEYETAARRVAFAAVDALARARSSLLASIESETVEELHSFRVSTDASAPLHLEPIEIAGELELDIRPICDGKLEELLHALDALAGEQVRAVETGMFQRLSELTAATGNQVDAAGRPLTHELMLEMLDKMDIAFDDHGEAQLTFVAGPGLVAKLQALPEMTAEQQLAYDDLMARKRAQFDAGRRERRLRGRPAAP